VPSVLRIDGYRFYFYSHEPDEPPHVHVDKAEASAKIWLDDVRVARNLGFRTTHLDVILTHVSEHRLMLLEAWHEFFGDDR
jgi:hypothetical protein